MLDKELSDYVKNWETVDDTEEKLSKYQVEATLNHFHLDGIHYLGCDDLSADKLLYIGNSLKEIYKAKLAYLFPNQPCEVEFYIPKNP